MSVENVTGTPAFKALRSCSPACVSPCCDPRYGVNGVSVLANPSNDYWFGAKQPAREQLIAASFRAIENRRDALCARDDNGDFGCAVLCVGKFGDARQVGLDVPVRPQRGQVIVTERYAPILPLPAGGIRQTGEGTFQIGATQEEVGYDISTTVAITTAWIAMLQTLTAMPTSN